MTQTFNISIHAPRKGRDFDIKTGKQMNVEISIHAPRKGRDVDETIRKIMLHPFQSTRPARGATKSKKPEPKSVKFQSTRPARGATVIFPWDSL